MTKATKIYLLIVVIAMAWFAVGVLNGIAEQAQKDEVRLAIDAVIDGYGYDACRVVRWNPQARTLTIRIKDPLTTGTDSWCMTSAILFHKLCSLQKGLELTVESESGWVPSRENPMTVTWTRELIKDGLY